MYLEFDGNFTGTPHEEIKYSVETWDDSLKFWNCILISEDKREVIKTIEKNKQWGFSIRVMITRTITQVQRLWQSTENIPTRAKEPEEIWNAKN